MGDFLSGYDVNNVCVQRQNGSISRDQFIAHNLRMIEENRRDELWMVDSKYIYAGYVIYCHLQPYVEEKIRENEALLSEDISSDEDDNAVERCQHSSSRKSRLHKSKVKLLEKQRSVLHFIRVQKPYNHVLHHLSIFKLEKEVIAVAKDKAVIAELSEDPQLSQKDEENMKLIQSYMQSIRRNNGSDDDNDDVFDECFEVITRDRFIDHNKAIQDNEIDDHLWTHDGKRVYDGVLLHNMALPFMKQSKQPYNVTERNFHHFTYKPQSGAKSHCYKPHFRSYSTSFHFMCMLTIKRGIADKIKQKAAIGRLGANPECEIKERDQIQDLIKALQLLENKTEIIQDFANCAARHYNNITRQSSYDSIVDNCVDINNRVFTIPSDVDVDSFRHWPDYIWFDRESDRKWIDDWTAAISPTSPGLQLVDVRGYDSVDTDESSPCWHTPWREDWQAFDVDIQGEAAWEVIPQDIIKSDEATLTQLVTLEKRQRRSDKINPEHIAKIQKRLSQYFIDKYGYSREEISVYNHWSDHMKIKWQEFINLCHEWQPGYVQLRDAQQESSGPPEPWQSFPNPDELMRLQDCISEYFQNHRYVKCYDPDQHKRWMSAMQQGWQQFQDLCKSWTPDDVPKIYKDRINTVSL